jgi:hypothetical protein
MQSNAAGRRVRLDSRPTLRDKLEMKHASSTRTSAYSEPSSWTSIAVLLCLGSSPASCPSL